MISLLPQVPEASAGGIVDSSTDLSARVTATETAETAARKAQLQAEERWSNPAGDPNYRPPTEAEIRAYREAKARRDAAVATCIAEMQSWGEDPALARPICMDRNPAPTPPEGVTVNDDTPDPAVVAQQAVSELELPTPAIQIGPPPSINRWNVAIVGYPLWLWTEDQASMDHTVTTQGITITMQARRTTTTFDISDGTRLQCQTMTRWTRGGTRPAQKSPTCGHTFTTTGDHTITATSQWQVTWTTLGQTGVINLTPTAALQVPVRELQSVNTGG